MRKFCILLMFCPLFSIGQKRSLIGFNTASAEVKKAEETKPSYPGYVKSIICDDTTAIAVAEPILFKIYGKGNIIAQRPYEVYKVGSYWFLRGTLPAPTKKRDTFIAFTGGTFTIIISSKDGSVIKLDHGE